MEQLVQSIAQRLPAGPSFRQKAWAEHTRMGWPTKKTETWIYTSCSHLLRAPLSQEKIVPTLTAHEQAQVKDWSQQFDVVVIKNGALLQGRVSPGWASLDSVEPRWLDGFAPAMAASAQNALHIEIATNTLRPILFAHFLDGESQFNSHIIFINIKSRIRATVVEISVAHGSGFASTQSFVQVDDGAQLSYARLAQAQPNTSNFSDCQIHLRAQANLNLLNINLGAKWSRSSVQVELAGRDANAQLSGISFGLDKQHSDQRIEVRHLAAHTQSRQLFKGVWRDSARGVLNGKIYIAKGAQKVDSAQLNQNLLLSAGAEVDTKPELEVYADDVKANHGASIGRMDEDKLFYFLSRGISRTEAVQLLAEGFVKDVVLKWNDDALQPWLMSEIRKIIPQYSRDLEMGIEGPQ